MKEAQAIKTILEGAGYGNIYINNVNYDRTQDTTIQNTITIMLEPTSGVDNYGQNQIFGIYVKRADAEQAESDCRDIYQLLNTYRGRDKALTSGGIKIAYIETLTKPFPFNYGEPGGSIFLARFRMSYIDVDITLY